jgi:hypothetical protein
MAIKFAREIKDLIINQRNDEAIAKHIADRAKSGQLELTPYERQSFVDKLPRTDNEELIKEIYNEVWLGVEEEFGKDATPQVNQRPEQILPPEDKVLAGLNRRYTPSQKVPEGQEEAVQTATPTKKQQRYWSRRKKIISEVSQ